MEIRSITSLSWLALVVASATGCPQSPDDYGTGTPPVGTNGDDEDDEDDAGNADGNSTSEDSPGDSTDDGQMDEDGDSPPPPAGRTSAGRAPAGMRRSR